MTEQRPTAAKGEAAELIRRHFPMDSIRFRRLEINGGRVCGNQLLRLTLPATASQYADAQIDDYGGKQGGQRLRRRDYPWRPGVTLQLRARFSHPADELLGTAGFGFWNAPFGDPTAGWIALPQACWFFFGSPPTDLPLAPSGAGQGWFAATVDATRFRGWSMAPLAPAVLLLNQVSWLRQWIWPQIQKRLGIAYAQLQAELREWHRYTLHWRPDGCAFLVDGQPLLQTSQSPRGPLGFVCWLDNQFLVVTSRGRLKWGVLSTPQEQWLEVTELEIRPPQVAQE